MFFKKAILAAAFAMTASSAVAATCTLGSCSTPDLNGQNLSSGVHFDINEIVGDGVTANGETGAFTFEGTFNNDTVGDGAVAAAFLVSTTQGSITDLILNIVSPTSVIASYSIAADVVANILLAAAPNQAIGFTVTGNATRGTFGGDPDINLSIAAIPLPAGALLMGTALAGFGAVRRRKAKS